MFFSPESSFYLIDVYFYQYQTTFSYYLHFNIGWSSLFFLFFKYIYMTVFQ